jgi:outer membrane putative beta-barrel porin/alpha-amylase
MKRTLALAILGAPLIGATPVHAQPVTVDQLQAALRERDATIAALEKRISALEAASQSGATAAVGPAAAAAPAQFNASQGADRGDEELQALSRGLVQQGLLVLPKGQFEVAPGLSYSHSQKQGLVLVDTPEGISIAESQRARQDALDGALTVRYGLPWRSQIQLRVPYSWHHEEVALGDGTVVKNHDTHIGDIEVELAHQLVREGHGLPGITAAVSWRFPTGRDVFHAASANVATGTGTHQLTGRLTAFKSLDPIVAYGSLSYSYTFSRNEDFGRVDPGNAIDLTLGALLAVSPDTSLNFSFAQQFRGHTRVDGQSIAGSNGVAAVAQFGIDQLLGSRSLLSASLGIGLTNDAPDYQFLISTPIRFK